ncbi:hypothetical protein JIN85_03985 [Luteolibacter pohnpeiensis]|uniref:Uncharacterized protein n=1 Tax=Luteolibacter pohnpeiensis TaxID=454153 RepID=A0A934S334_9BACT|nr:hypothetical protein [Luteolibacter pohnpeiensis]MBK1881561.1 hypothetical protein [Luteolibacter pohnpeiensis]
MKTVFLKYAIVLWVTILPAMALPVRFLAWDGNISGRDLKVLSGEEGKKIEGLNQTRKTAPYRVAVGDDHIVYLQAADRKDAEGKPVVLRIPILPNVKEPLILLLPNPNEPSGITGIPFEDSSDGFKFGSFRMLNMTKGQLGCAFGKDRKVLKPRGSEDFAPGGTTPTPIAFVGPARPKDPLFTSVWTPDPDIRNLVIIAPGTDPRLGPLAIKIVPESRVDFEMQQSLNSDKESNAN